MAVQLSQVKTTKEQLEKQIVHLMDHNARLELQANQMPELKKTLHQRVEQIKQKDQRCHRLFLELEGTTSQYKTTKEKYLTLQFKMGVLSATRERLRKSLNTTANQLQLRNVECVKERHQRLDKDRELKKVRQKHNFLAQQNQCVLLQVEHASMQWNDCTTELTRVLLQHEADTVVSVEVWRFFFFPRLFLWGK